MMYLPRVATVTFRALKGVSQLVLMCASTPEAVRNCNSAISSRSATALESCGCTSTISDSVNQRIRSMSCTARSMTTPTFDIRGGNGPTRVIAIERISSPDIACLMAATAGLKRSTCPTIKVTPARRARSEEHTSELQSQSNLVCRLLLEKKKKTPCTLQITKKKKKK